VFLSSYVVFSDFSSTNQRCKNAAKFKSELCGDSRDLAQINLSYSYFSRAALSGNNMWPITGDGVENAVK
jgi:hypothetical protein